MKPFAAVKEILRRSPVFRALAWLLVVGFVFFMTIVIGKNVRKIPIITQINPTVGSPGDVMVIDGQNFGSSRGTSSVEIAGSKVPGTGYLSWQDSQIRIILPSNVQDGLVIVGTSAGKSEPGFFANEVGIPQAVRPAPKTTMPTIASISPASASVGQLVNISGTNFGTSRGNSQVLFFANRDDQDDSTFISANELDYDYEYWSDTEIHVRVPDGAASGPVFVETSHGNSGTQTFNLLTSTGKKEYVNHRTYVVQVTSDISTTVPNQEASVTLFVPRPVTSASQPNADLNDCFPEPMIKDDPHVVIHQRSLNRIINNKQRFSQSFVVSVYGENTQIRPSQIKPYSETKNVLYTACTSPDNCVPSNSEEVRTLAAKIVGREKNPYEQARLLYNHVISKYKLLETPRTGNVSVLDMIKKDRGDAYDFAVIFTALCRSLGIPALPVSGILVENDSSKPHWWTEIYFENFGWFPVDTALGAGLKYTPFIHVEDRASFYFGNMDNQHIAFSRGWKEIRPSLSNSKIVQRPRSYALQSIWEEASDSASSYSSLWNTPAIQGIY